MFPVKEFTDGPAGLPSLINYFEFVDEGVLFNRDGSFLGCFYYGGPDMDSSLGMEEDQLTAQAQSVFESFGNGWSVHVDLIRAPAVSYPATNHFNDATSVLIESHRRARYEKEGDHFENIHTISFCYLPSVVENKAVNDFFVQNASRDGTPTLEFVIGVFNRKLAEFQGNISNKIRIKRMNSAEMMTFLHRCICGGKSEVPVPQPSCYLNHYLGAHEFTGGHEPMIDDNHVGVVTLTQFPYESYSGILNVLSTLPFEYRFSSRFLFYDPVDALGIIEEYQGKYLGMKYSIGQMIMGAFGKDPRLNPDAANRSVLTKIEETRQAQEAIELGQVNYGYATFVVVVLESNKTECKRKMEFWIQDIGNYLGMQAGHASINQPVMSIDPIEIFTIGVEVAKKMLTIPVDWNIFNDVLVALLAAGSAAAVLFCFAVIGLELILVQIGGHIILAGGVFLLGFAGVPWTREYAERYVHTFFQVGIKMIFIYVLVGIGMSLSQNWVTVLNQAGKGQIIDTYLAVAVASYVYYKLCTKLPDQAVTWLTGRFAMGFETATDIKAGIKTAVAMPAAVMDGVHRVAGMARAFGAADQAAKATLAGQDKKETQWNMSGETIKTLGAAWKQEKWDKAVDGTLGGKMAKDIAASLDSKTKTKSDDGSGDFSI